MKKFALNHVFLPSFVERNIAWNLHNPYLLSFLTPPSIYTNQPLIGPLAARSSHRLTFRHQHHLLLTPLPRFFPRPSPIPTGETNLPRAVIIVLFTLQRSYLSPKSPVTVSSREEEMTSWYLCCVFAGTCCTVAIVTLIRGWKKSEGEKKPVGVTQIKKNGSILTLCCLCARFFFFPFRLCVRRPCTSASCGGDHRNADEFGLIVILERSAIVSEGYRSVFFPVNYVV